MEKGKALLDKCPPDVMKKIGVGALGTGITYEAYKAYEAIRTNNNTDYDTNDVINNDDITGETENNNKGSNPETISGKAFRATTYAAGIAYLQGGAKMLSNPLLSAVGTGVIAAAQSYDGNTQYTKDQKSGLRRTLEAATSGLATAGVTRIATTAAISAATASGLGAAGIFAATALTQGAASYIIPKCVRGISDVFTPTPAKTEQADTDLSSDFSDHDVKAATRIGI